VQKTADTYHVLLRQVSSQSEQNSGCSGHSKVVACPAPPGHGRNFRKALETITHALTLSAVLLLECAVIDRHNGTVDSSKSSTLEVACPPPGIGAKI
jgi:hypothetical protein